MDLVIDFGQITCALNAVQAYYYKLLNIRNVLVSRKIAIAVILCAKYFSTFARFINK